MNIYIRIIQGEFNNKIHIITVSKELHDEFILYNQLKFDKFGLPCFEFQEYPAKNVGIRNANGKYVLITNPDNYFTKDILNEIEDLCKSGFLDKHIKGSRRGKAPDVRNFNHHNFGENINLTKYLDEFDITIKQFKEFEFGADGDFTLLSKENAYKIKGYIEYPFCWTHFELPFLLSFLEQNHNGISQSEYWHKLKTEYNINEEEHAYAIKNIHYHFAHKGSGNDSAKSGKSFEKSILPFSYGILL